MNHFNKLEVWKKSINFATDIYQLTEKFPPIEKFGLRSQLTRAAVSIPSNISEGAGRNSDRDFCRFLTIAMGSAFEIETQLILSYKLNYINAEEVKLFLSRISEIQKMIYSLIKKKESKIKPTELIYFSFITGTIITLVVELISNHLIHP